MPWLCLGKRLTYVKFANCFLCFLFYQFHCGKYILQISTIHSDAGDNVSVPVKKLTVKPLNKKSYEIGEYSYWK